MRKGGICRIAVPRLYFWRKIPAWKLIDFDQGLDFLGWRARVLSLNCQHGKP